MKLFKVIFDEVKTYELKIEANSKQKAREIASHMVNYREPSYSNWEHFSTEEIKKEQD